MSPRVICRTLFLWTPSSIACTGQTAVQRPQRVHFSLLQRTCQGRSFVLSEDGLSCPSGSIARPPDVSALRRPYHISSAENPCPCRVPEWRRPARTSPRRRRTCRDFRPPRRGGASCCRGA